MERKVDESVIAACYYDGEHHGTAYVTGPDGVPRWVCSKHVDLARDDDGTEEYLKLNQAFYE